MIPLGQPVLRGHHSQRRHERGLARTIASGMRASFENSVKAAEMRARADNIEAAADHAIYDDEPGCRRAPD